MLGLLRTLSISAFALVALQSAASAATVFERVTNDGVFALSAAQQAQLGTTSTYVGFLRGRSNNGGSSPEGTTFNVSDIAALCGAQCGTGTTFRNGDAPGLSYTGGFLAALGPTTVAVGGNSFLRAVAIFFDGSTITFRGTASTTATFNGSQSRATLPDLAPVPLPAAGWLLLAGLGGLVVAKRRKATMATA